MHTEMQRQAEKQHFFDQHAQGWEDRNYSPEKLQQVATLIQGLPLAQGMNIVDVGCGQGVLLPFVRAAVGAAGRIAAVDPSACMLGHAALRDAEVWPLLARAENLPLLAGWADVVLCFSAFPHFEDKSAAVREFFRVLKTGGRAYVLHIDGRQKLNHLHDQHHAVCGDHLPCPHGMKALFEAAGFVHMQAEDAEDHYYFSARKEENCEQPMC